MDIIVTQVYKQNEGFVGVEINVGEEKLFVLHDQSILPGLRIGEIVFGPDEKRSHGDQYFYAMPTINSCDRKELTFEQLQADLQNIISKYSGTLKDGYHAITMLKMCEHLCGLEKN